MGVDTKATTQTSPHSPVILKFLKNTTTCFAFLPLNKKKTPPFGGEQDEPANS
jgi:hypothetical protein